ncbi:DUF1517 domain-containing protein [Gloeobacter morelensis]|uniref:DUF1517 domain-containing protein n=1 Tax=Gloeobacter morelensis MG652769 TaxID=2781736 RepID=A0ABY3PIM3_9CYAN|nr:DUF1517 domain-containing protein [Gloeobacter morelensis]UFP93387.1 DUF1517 domain-containing protein [Gloeobacter morelensis MG652769]
MAPPAKILLRRAASCSLALGIALGAVAFDSAEAWARRSSGGRIGGGSFRAPSRSYTPAPSPRTYSPAPGGYYSPPPVVPVPVPIPGPGYYPPVGGGYAVGGPGIGLSSIILIVVVVGAGFYVLRVIRRGASGAVGGQDGAYAAGFDPDKVEIFRLQVALLASAKQLQRDLTRIAEQADTTTPEGLARLNQEVSLALLRNPEFWVYAKSDQQILPRLTAESQFNRLALTERTKYTDETVSRSGEQSALVKRTFVNDNPDETAEYIVVTILVASESGVPTLEAVRSSDQLRQALATIGSLSGEQLVALEIIWSPSDEKDTLTAEELLTQYTDLVRI